MKCSIGLNMEMGILVFLLSKLCPNLSTPHNHQRAVFTFASSTISRRGRTTWPWYQETADQPAQDEPQTSTAHADQRDAAKQSS